MMQPHNSYSKQDRQAYAHTFGYHEHGVAGKARLRLVCGVIAAPRHAGPYAASLRTATPLAMHIRVVAARGSEHFGMRVNVVSACCGVVSHGDVWCQLAWCGPSMVSCGFSMASCGVSWFCVAPAGWVSCSWLGVASPHTS